MAEGLVEAGGKVYCLDLLPEPPQAFQEAQARLKGDYGASLEYCNVDVTHEEALRKCIGDIASTHKRLDGLIAGKHVFKFVEGHTLTNFFHSCRHPASDPRTRFQEARHRQDARRQLYRRVPSSSRMRPSNDGVQDPRLNLPCSKHEWNDCQPRLHRTCLQFVQSSSGAAGAEFGHGMG